MKHLLPLLLLAAALPAGAQQHAEEVWTQFAKKDKDTYLYGYKDANGRIRIPAKFGSFVPALKFRHIAAVTEQATLEQYYLLKNGRQVGRDSVYMFDYTYDCEQEGLIRFRSRAQNRVGFLNGQGQPVIPAVYNALSRFYNGLAVGLIGARAVCLSGESDTMHCEHPSWVGGRWVLLNERNQVLADSLPLNQLNNLDWYSLRLNAPAIDTATTCTFRAANGDRYTFMDYEKEFMRWFYGVFVPAVRTGEAGQVTPLCFTELATSGKPFRGWRHFERAAFVQKFYQSALLPKLGGLRSGTQNVDVFSEDLNMLIFGSPRFQSFLTDCGEHFRAKYPVFNVVINPLEATGKRSFGHQEHFTFIRTAEGYRLFSVAL